MPDQETLQQLSELQTRAKALAGQRDKLIRDTGIAERKLEEAVEKLKELGIDATGLGSKELQAMAEDLGKQLSAKMTEFSQKVEEGEKLVERYQQVQGA